MPRWASRITLELTDVRVQRLQEISEEDALAEGVQLHWRSVKHPIKGTLKCWPTARVAFEELWHSTHGKRSPWSSKPWVWALTFRRIIK